MKSRGWFRIILVLLIAAAWPSPLSAADTDLLRGKQPGFDVGDRDDYQRTFALDNVPSNPKLQLDFKVVRKGRCPITYRATSIYLNSQLVAEIDFRRFAKNDNKSLTISIPPNALRVGNNQLLIRTGWCQYDVDVMRLNNLVLVHE